MSPKGLDDLHGWGQIATHLKISERAAKYWAVRFRDMPVHRYTGIKEVAASTSALDQWKANRRSASSSAVAQDTEIAAVRLRMNREGWPAKVLNEYYGSSCFRDGDIALRSFACEGSVIRSTIAAKKQWTGLSLALNAEPECRCQLSDSATGVPPRRFISDVITEFDGSPEVWLNVNAVNHQHARRCRDWVLSSEAELDDYPVYRMKAIQMRPHSNVSMTVGLDSYFRYRFTIGLLDEELAIALHDTDFSVGKIISERNKYLPLRAHLLPRHAISNLKLQIRVPSVQVMFAVARQAKESEFGADFGFPIQETSSLVSTGRGALCVVPAAIHQPCVNAQRDASFSRTVYRELYEELFGGEDAQGSSNRLTSDCYCAQRPELDWFREHEGAFDIVCTSFGSNVMRGSFSISVLLVVRDTWYWENYASKVRPNREVSRLDIMSTRDEAGLRRLIKNPSLGSSGLVSLIEGLLFLRALDPRRVKLPAIERISTGA